jgi:hypothetical protein
MSHVCPPLSSDYIKDHNISDAKILGLNDEKVSGSWTNLHGDIQNFA